MEDKDAKGSLNTEMKPKYEYPSYADVPIRRHISEHWKHIVDFIFECVEEHVKSNVYKNTDKIQPPDAGGHESTSRLSDGGVEEKDSEGPCDFPLFYDVWAVGASGWVK